MGSRARGRLASVLALGALALAVGLGILLFRSDPADRCVEAGGRWDPRRRACEMAPPAKGPVNVAVGGATGAARALDVTSFDNSITPRRRPGAVTLADYGFTQVVRTRDGVELYNVAQSWMFGVRVLQDAPDRKLLCIIDSALAGGTFAKVRAIEVKAADGGMLRATGKVILDPACPESARK